MTQTNNKKEQCQAFARKTQSMFPDVRMMSSDELLAMDHRDNNIVLVDVRSEPEQAVSVVEGGISLSQLDTSKLPRDAHLVTCCAVGFRACLEARRLKEENPTLQVSSLDGIACCTHVLKNGNSNSNARKIIEPWTGQESRRVHTFGKQWDCVSDDFEPLTFSGLDYAIYTAQFGASMAWKTIRNKFMKYAAT